MERKLASIQQIADVQPIEGADSIEVATVLGWQCVVNKGEFKVNDLCVFFEPDAVLPEWPEFEFMRRYYYENNFVGVKGFRIKTIKLRKQISQGLAMPLLAFKACEEGLLHRMEIGADVTSLFEIRKYEPPEPSEPGAQIAGGTKGNWPEFLSKTDETRIQAVPSLLEKHRGEAFFVTEKLDGTSFTAYLKDGNFGICSRNNEIRTDSETVYAKIARELELEAKLRSLSLYNVAIQGEIVGPGIQKNKYKLDEHRLYVFSLLNLNDRSLYAPEEQYRMISDIGLLHVPYLSMNILEYTLQELVDVSVGYSALYETQREGLVFRPCTPQYSQKLGGHLSFKVINPKFLLKHDE